MRLSGKPLRGFPVMFLASRERTKFSMRLENRVVHPTLAILIDRPIRRLYFGCVVGLALVSSPSAANVLTPMSLNDQYASSDVVVVVRAGQNTLCNVDSAIRPCVEFSETLYLKGRGSQAARIQYVVTYSRIRELTIECCEAGKTYLMFLREYRGNLFPVRGHWSIIELQRPNELPIGRRNSEAQ